MKKGKELKIDRFKNYNVAYGSVNNKEPKALYINISCWAKPLIDDDLNYNRIIRNFDKKIRQFIYQTLLNDKDTPFLKDRTIVDFDIRKSGVKFGKCSFTNNEITLFLKEQIPINEIVTAKIINLTEKLTKEVFDKNDSFEFNKKKS
jgi:hypothetical protein